MREGEGRGRGTGVTSYVSTASSCTPARPGSSLPVAYDPLWWAAVNRGDYLASPRQTATYTPRTVGSNCRFGQAVLLPLQRYGAQLGFPGEPAGSNSPMTQKPKLMPMLH